MHLNTRKWLEDKKKKHPEAFTKAKVLEIGSYNVNGTARDFFEDCDYTGVDIMEGKDVDIVAPALETKFKEGEFDTLVSVCMFEHDPNWKETIHHNKQWLKKGGLFIISLGSNGCRPHFYPVFVVVDHDEFIQHVKDEGFRIVSSIWEQETYPDERCPAGILDVVLQKL